MLERSPGGVLRDPKWRDPGATAHEILGIDAQASPEMIRRTYVRLVRLCHPDHFSDRPQFQEQAELATKRINEAYEALTRPGHGRLHAASREGPRRVRQGARLQQLPAAHHDSLFTAADPGGLRVIFFILTVVVSALSSLLLVLVIAVWFGLSQ